MTQYKAMKVWKAHHEQEWYEFWHAYNNLHSFKLDHSDHKEYMRAYNKLSREREERQLRAYYEINNKEIDSWYKRYKEGA